MSESASNDFARLYRPVTFDDLVGNTYPKEALKTLLKADKLDRVVMFHGPSGIGKTTIARIAGKALLCKSPVDGQACDKCENCVALNDKFILEGASVPGLPIKELNITIESGKSDLLPIIEEMKMRPIGNKKKIYILDEFQGMSHKAQESFLKLLEEPHDWLYIFICTTHPQNLLPTILTRVTSYALKPPARVELRDRLKYVCKKEGIKHENSALDLIIKISNNSPRMALKRLGQLSHLGPITKELVVNHFQIARIDMFLAYFDVISKDIFETLQFIETLPDTYSTDYISFLEGLSNFVIDAFHIKMKSSLENYSADEAKSISKLFETVDLPKIIQLLRLIEDALKNLTNPKFTLLMLTLKYGYPKYFDPLNTTAITDELRKEETASISAYNKNKHDRKKSSTPVDEPATTEDLMALFTDSYVVVEE